MLWQSAPKISKKLRLQLKSYDDLTAQLLVNRGIESEDSAYKFFNPKLSDLPNRKNLRDIEKATKRILDAVKSQEKIVIYGDYDVDGICSSSMLFDFLYRYLGAQVVPYIPSRFDEGYGLNEKALKQIKSEGTKLVVTVDCGVRDGQLLKQQAGDGLDFLITDHHEPPEDRKDIKALLNNSVAVVHPSLSENFDFKQICATTVVWYLICELIEVSKKEDLLKNEINAEEYLDLVALGTVCDVMPLIEQNRIFLKEGLERIRNTSNPGLKKLLIHSGVFSQEIGQYHIGFIVGPRLNAVGRLENALDAVRLLTSKNANIIKNLAEKLSSLNTERQILTKEFLEKAEKQIEVWGYDKKLIFITGDQWPEGIVGLVAGKLCEKYHKPVLVASLDKAGVATGSARSITPFHITQAISASADILERFGGHSQAAGFTIKATNIEKFSQNLLKQAMKLTEEELKKKLFIEADLSEDMLNYETISMIKRFEPFGFGNKQPVFVLRGVKLLDKKVVGSAGVHIKLSIQLGQVILDVIGFNKIELFNNLNIGDILDIAGLLKENQFMGETRLQIDLSDIKSSNA